MKDLHNFIVEYRTAGSKNKSTLADIDMNKIEGKPAEKNGTDGKMGANEPIDKKVDAELNTENVEFDKSKMDINEKRLYMKFKAEDDFFIVGKAGWGKTSIIHRFAKKFGYIVRTFYLDKCEAVDLGGTPVPVQNNKGKVQIEVGIPPFAEEIAENPDKKYLLFFDEMNQAAPDVMNALMPIVLEHEIAGEKYDNFFCGAAGNFESENSAVNELSGPLKSRFKPLIVWETDTEDAWKSTFNFLHKEWDEKVTKGLMDLLEKNAMIFENPRELEQKLLSKYVYKMIQKKDNFDVDQWEDHLQRLVKENLTRAQESEVSRIAETIYNVVKNGGKDVKSEESGRRAKKDAEMVPDNVKQAIKSMMKDGWFPQEEGSGSKKKTVKYGVSRESIGDAIEDCNMEMIERVIRKFEADGIKFKYEKDSDWEKDHSDWKHVTDDDEE